jgi:hypothetical protein
MTPDTVAQGILLAFSSLCFGVAAVCVLFLVVLFLY